MSFYYTKYKTRNGARYLVHTVKPERAYTENTSVVYDGMQSFYAEDFDPAMIGRIGSWNTIVHAFGNVFNRGVWIIDPQVADITWMTAPAYESFNVLNLGGTAPIYIKSPYASWDQNLEPSPWSLYRIYCRNHYEYQRFNFPQIIDWLSPGWLQPAVSTVPTGHRPYITFQAPHGRWGAFGPSSDELEARGEMEFYAPISLPKMGLGHLVEGYFEMSRLWRRCGVYVNYQTAAPDTSRENERFVSEATDYMFDMIADNRLSYHCDACVLYDRNSGAADIMRRLHATGVGVMKEGAVAPDTPYADVDYWIERQEYPYQILHKGDGGGGFYDQFIDQKSWAITQGFPAWGSGGFFSTYGDQWWLIMVLGTEFGVSYPSTVWGTYSGADQAAKRAAMFDAFETYLNALKDGIQEFLPGVPNSIALLHHADIRLAGMLTQGFSDTAPRAGYTRADFEALAEP